MGHRAAWAVAIILALAATAAASVVIYTAPGAVFSDDKPPRVSSLEPGPEPIDITVAQGESASSIGAGLEQQGIIRDRRLFEVLVGLTGVQDSLEAGDYEFDKGLPAIEVVHRIAQGRTASRSITIPEGLRLEEVGDLLERNGIVAKSDFMAALDKSLYDLPFLQQVQSDSLEGFIFPARYEFKRGAPARSVVETMLIGFQDNVADKLQLEGEELTLDQLVTLASIVEREAVVEEERPIIASVFRNRLRAGIPLGADPTVQFAVANTHPEGIPEFGWWKQELSVDDLALDSPYNTYIYAGLPPGPIANPGFDAMQAVVRPADTEYLFFVAIPDGSGRHAFAVTLEEHLLNVEKYRQGTGQ